MDDSITVPQHAVSPPALPLPFQGCSSAFSHVEIEMIQKMTKQVNLSCKNPSFWWEKSFKEVKTEAIADCCALSWASRHRSQAENRSAALFLIWPNQSGRTALKKVKEERVESHAGKTQQQSMAQIEVLPHRHPACYLKHISQAWKDSPCSPQDHWRWTSSRAADEMQVNQRKNRQKLQNLCTKLSPKLSACSRIDLRTNKFQVSVSMRC